MLAKNDVVEFKINNLSLRIAKSRYQKLTKNQLEVITKYDIDNLVGRGNSDTTRENQIDTLIRFAIQTGKEFDGITKEEINIWLSKYKGSSQQLFNVEIKKFFRWFKKPELVAHLKSKETEEKLTSDDMWTQKEIRTLLETIDSDTRIGKRDQAMKMCMWDMMLERCAVKNLNIGDIKDIDKGMRIKISLEITNT